jgi:hypothetical protein
MVPSTPPAYTTVPLVKQDKLYSKMSKKLDNGSKLNESFSLLKLCGCQKQEYSNVLDCSKIS